MGLLTTLIGDGDSSGSGTSVGETRKLSVTDASSAGGIDIVAPANTATGDTVVVLGGTTGNPNSSGAEALAVIGGGYNNAISDGIASTIAGGAHHTASATGGHTFIGGGSTHATSGDYSAVVGGLSNAASGLYSFIGGGRQNTASSNDTTIGGGLSNDINAPYGTIAGGNNQTVSAQEGSIGGGISNVIASGGIESTIAGGRGNSVSGEGAGILSGRSNAATGKYSSIVGGYLGKTTMYGQCAHASGWFAVQGDAQESNLVVRRSTTTATQSELFLDGAAERMVIGTDTTWAFSITVVARRTDADNESAGYKLEGVIDNNAGVTALVGTITKTVLAEDTAAWDVTAEADNTNDALVVKVTGEAAKTIRWVGRVELTQVSG